MLEWVGSLNNDKVLKLTAKVNFGFTNNMVESLNHIFKNEFLRERDVHDDTGLMKLLDLFDDYYNQYRYPIELYGYAPMEIVKGAIPDKHRFKDGIIKAQQKRYFLNKASTYCGVCR